MTVNSIVRTVGSLTFVLYKSHCCVCAFDHISMLKCTIEVLNIIVTIVFIAFFQCPVHGFRQSRCRKNSGPCSSVRRLISYSVSPGSSGEF